MKSSTIMRRAAKIAEKKVEGACYAIQEAFGCRNDRFKKWDVRDMFAEYFQPEGKGKYDYWFGVPYDQTEWFHNIPNLENQNHRILAMLLMADIFESMGD